MPDLILPFQEHEITVIDVNGKPAWVARDVGRGLEYTNNGGHFISRIREWQDDMIEGVDFDVLRGVIPPNGTGPTSMLVLYESGLYMALAKTNKPKGVEFRRWLVTECMPQIARTGKYDSGKTVAPSGNVVDKNDAAHRKLSMMEAREARLERQRVDRAYANLIKGLKSRDDIGAQVVETYVVRRAEAALGQSLMDARPRLPNARWRTMTAILASFGVSTGLASWAGRWLKESHPGITSNPEMCQASMTTRANSEGTAPQTLYSDKAAELIRMVLVGKDKLAA